MVRCLQPKFKTIHVQNSTQLAKLLFDQSTQSRTVPLLLLLLVSTNIRNVPSFAFQETVKNLFFQYFFNCSCRCSHSTKLIEVCTREVVLPFCRTRHEEIWRLKRARFHLSAAAALIPWGPALKCPHLRTEKSTE